MGDFNADCSYVSQRKLNKLDLRKDGFHWLVPDTWDTTVSSTNCAYDRWVGLQWPIQSRTGRAALRPEGVVFCGGPTIVGVLSSGIKKQTPVFCLVMSKRCTPATGTGNGLILGPVPFLAYLSFVGLWNKR